MSKRIIVLTSGGLDSVTTAYACQQRFNFDVTLLHVIYGQRHAIETYCARYHAQRMGVPLHIVRLPLWSATDTSLIGDGAVEQHAYKAQHMSTYVPARNTVFAAVAMSYMEQLKIPALGLGIHLNEAYPDTTPAWAEALLTLMNVSMELSVFDNQEIELVVPFLQGQKTDILEMALHLRVPVNMTWSCYAPVVDRGAKRSVWTPCTKCATCLDRESAFKAIGANPAEAHIPITVDNTSVE